MKLVLIAQLDLFLLRVVQNVHYVPRVTIQVWDQENVLHVALDTTLIATVRVAVSHVNWEVSPMQLQIRIALFANKALMQIVLPRVSARHVERVK